MKKIISGMFSLDKMREAPWNSNVMPAEEYARLGRDMKTGGPNAINPILLAEYGVVFPGVYVVVDGCHRSRKARELRWTEIRGELDPNIDSEEKARAIGYVKNTERGNQDPYKLAENFAWFAEVKGMTHEEIAKMHNLDRTSVTKILSLNNITSDVKKKLSTVPYVTISHLKPIAAAPHHIQREVAKHINKRDHSTVEDITRITCHITEEFEKRERLRKAVEKAKFPKCPKCGRPAKDFSYRGGDYVQCDNFDNWSLSRGIERERPVSTASGEPKIPQSIKTGRTMEEFRTAFRKIAAKVLSNIDADRIDYISIDGRGKDGKRVSFTGSFGDWNTSVELGSARYAMKKDIDLSASSCKIKDHPDIKTRVKTGEYIDSKQKLAKLERQVQDLFREYGVKKRRVGDV